MAVGPSADVGVVATGVVDASAGTTDTDAMVAADAVAAAVGPAPMAVGAVAAVVAGLGMPLDAVVANDAHLHVPSVGAGPFIFPAPPPPPLASHLNAAGPAAALVAARAAAAEGPARVRAAAFDWEHKRDAADALAHQIAEARAAPCPPCLTRCWGHLLRLHGSPRVPHRCRRKLVESTR